MSSSDNGGGRDYDEERSSKTNIPILCGYRSSTKITRYPLESFALALDSKALVAAVSFGVIRHAWRLVPAAGMVHHDMH